MESDFGRYELVERLAVRAATDLFVVTSRSSEIGSGEKVVLKRLLDDSQVATFIDDATHAAKLAHPKIVQTLELGRIGDIPYVALEYVEGIDLLDLVRELARADRVVAPAVAVYIVHEVLDALAYAHALKDGRIALGIVHGRLSPAKILLGAKGDVKLCDFGVPRAVDSGRGEAGYGYLAPEQITEEVTDLRTDVFAVGVVLAELLTGRRLFISDNPLDVLVMIRDADLSRFEPWIPTIDARLVGILKSALHRHPDGRPASAAVFRDALGAWLENQKRKAPKKDLAALVTEVRGAVDAWRRDQTIDAPEKEFAAIGSVVKPRIRTVEIPPLTREPVTAPKLTPSRLSTSSPIEPDQSGNWSMPLSDRDTQPLRVVGTESRPRAMPRGSKPPIMHPSQQEAQQAGSKLEVSPDQSGDLTRVPPIRLLYQLMRSRSTGLLSVVRGDVRRDLYLRDGQLAGVWSNVPSDLFGAYLVAKSVLSDGELAMALAVMSEYGGKLGDALVGLGLMKHVEVFRHLNRHVRARVVELCTWTDGAFEWFRGKRNLREAFPLELDGLAVLGDGARSIPAPVIEAWIAKHRTAHPIALATEINAKRFRVPLLVETLAKLDGKTTVETLVAENRAHLGRVLYLLVATDLAS